MKKDELCSKFSNHSFRRLRLRKKLERFTKQVIAVDDDANDLEMLSSATLGITFNAINYLREHASGNSSLLNLYALLFISGNVKTLNLLLI